MRCSARYLNVLALVQSAPHLPILPLKSAPIPSHREHTCIQPAIRVIEVHTPLDTICIPKGACDRATESLDLRGGAVKRVVRLLVEAPPVIIYDHASLSPFSPRHYANVGDWTMLYTAKARDGALAAIME